MKRLVLLVLIGVTLLSVTPVIADGDLYVIAGGGGVGTKITSLPYTITAPGFYYLAGNLNAATGNGITINSDSVTLDLMGFCLSSSGGSWKGISNAVSHSNIEIRNGSLSGWSGNGIDLAAGLGTAGIRIVNVRVMGSSPYGIQIGGGVGILVKGCTVSDAANGIWVACGTISGNTVNNCSTYGIHLISGSIIGNTVYCNTGQTGIRISGAASDFTLVDQNSVTPLNGANCTPFSGVGTITYGTNTFAAPTL